MIESILHVEHGIDGTELLDVVYKHHTDTLE